MWASIVLALLCTMLLVSVVPLHAQLDEIGNPSDHGHHGAGVAAWEGSAQSVAYLERNHHLAGFFVLLMGCAELSQALHPTSLYLGQVHVASCHVVGQCHAPRWERPLSLADRIAQF